MYSRADVDAKFPAGPASTHMFARELAVNILKTCPEHAKRDALIDALLDLRDAALSAATWATAPEAQVASGVEAPTPTPAKGMFSRKKK